MLSPVQTKHCVKNPLFKKTHCFPTCALFYPIVLKRKIITAYICLLFSFENRQFAFPPSGYYYYT